MRVRKVEWILCMLLIICLFLSIANSEHLEITQNNNILGEQLDQSQETYDETVWLAPGTLYWQQFQPTLDSIIQVELMAMQGYAGSPDLELDIQNRPGDSLCHMEIPASELPSTLSWVSFDVPDVELLPGQTYYITVLCQAGSEYALGGAWLNPYPFGDSNIGSGWDWCFRTYGQEENIAPLAPQIEGPLEAKVREVTFYNFTAIDPNGDDIQYYIEFESGQGYWTDDFFLSGQQISRGWRWTQRGTQIVRAKARDTSGLESNWATLEITLPRARFNVFSMIKFEQMPFLRLLGLVFA